MATKKDDKEMLKEMFEKLKSELEKTIDEKLEEKNSDKFSEERKKEILENVNEIANESEEAIICVGDKQTFMAGSGKNLTTLLANVIKGLAQEGLPREDLEYLIEQIYEEE